MYNKLHSVVYIILSRAMKTKNPFSLEVFSRDSDNVAFITLVTVGYFDRFEEKVLPILAWHQYLLMLYASIPNIKKGVVGTHLTSSCINLNQRHFK